MPVCGVHCSYGCSRILLEVVGGLPMNPTYIWRVPSAAIKAYVLFLLGVCIVALVKLIIVWRDAPPFRFSRVAPRSDQLARLRRSSASLGRWIGCTCLVWGILTSWNLGNVCERLLDEPKFGLATIAVILADYAEVALVTLCVILLLYLIRWHFLARIDSLQNESR